MGRQLILGVFTFGLIFVSGASVTETHTPIASRWTYNEHLFAIFRDNCGDCHRAGGIAPMSLVTYQEAYPWAQSIREEVLGLRMPPWQAEDGFGDFSNGHALSATEMDMILEWSSGGYPQGPRDLQLETTTASSDWVLGEPGLELIMPEPFIVDASTNEVVRYFVLPTTSEADRFLAGADVMPGAGAIVRDVALYVDTTGTARKLDNADVGPGFAETDEFPTNAPVALWSPGQQQVLQQHIAHPMPTAADIVVRVHYKKTWITEGESFTDQSHVGLYFSDAPPTAIHSMLLSSPNTASALTLNFSHTVGEAVHVVALLPEVAIPAKDVQVVAVKPDGEQVPLLFLREPDTAWPTRYWFDTPIVLPEGTTIQVNAVLHPGAEQTPATSLFGADATAPIRLMLDYASTTPLAD